ncbi:MAG: hypothetical protein ACRDRL_06620 [Sciscionella sp.]
MGVLPAADPDDPGYGDQGRYVGDGAGQPRVNSGCRSTAVSLALALLGVAGLLLGLALAIAAIYLLASPSIAGEVIGLSIAAVVAVALIVGITVIVRMEAEAGK